MEKEIGGYFGMERFDGALYHAGLLPVNSGRNGLLYILKARNIKKLHIPAFLCDSVSRLCRRENVEYEVYEIGRDFLPIFPKKLGEGEWLYVVNYYGQIDNGQFLDLKNRYGNVIADYVQAFYQRPVPGIDTVYSCRKFFGVPDGGYVATDAFLEELPADQSRERMKHILGRFEESGSKYYRDFQENDEAFYRLPLRKMSLLTENLLRGVDYAAVKKIRDENYAALAAVLADRNRLVLKTPEGPYCYPFYCENGMEVKRALAAEKIYVPTLWPNVLEKQGTLEADYAANILPLPCDQRYDGKDMMRIAHCVLRYSENKRLSV